MITITYTNGSIQNITPGGSFYATVVEKKRGNKFVKIKLEPSEWRKHIMDVAEDIACDLSFVRQCSIHKIEVSFPFSGTDNQVRLMNPFSQKEDFIPSTKSYKNEQSRLRKWHKNDPKPKTFMRFGITN